jgi:hypothetical protein
MFVYLDEPLKKAGLAPRNRARRNPTISRSMTVPVEASRRLSQIPLFNGLLCKEAT